MRPYVQCVCMVHGNEFEGTNVSKCVCFCIALLGMHVCLDPLYDDFVWEPCDKVHLWRL